MSNFEIERKWKVNKLDATKLVSNLYNVEKKEIFQTYLIIENSFVKYDFESNLWVIEFDVVDKQSSRRYNLTVPALKSEYSDIKEATSEFDGSNLVGIDVCAMRFRVINSDQYIFTFKRQTDDPAVAYEFEYDVAVHSEPINLYMNSLSASLKKDRFIFPWNGQKVELDFFQDEAYMDEPLLEVEFKNKKLSDDYDISGLPITEEVTGDHSHSNKNKAIENYKRNFR
jgi:CYTH domain-containing protein